MKPAKKDANYILQIGSYPPRECGIATFTEDLTLALNKQFNPLVKTGVVALNDQPTSIYNYNSNVLNQITATEIGHYVDLARLINKKDDIRIVNIQHEFGIFGGDQGDYLIPFLQAVEKPVVVTFHSVLPNPDSKLLNVVQTIAQFAKALIVMNQSSLEILVRDYSIFKSKIAVVPHGIPQIPFESSDKAKEELNLKGKTVLTTFGMISPNKGLEYAIRSLPGVVKKFPNVLYIIVGATHPNLIREEGEAYRNSLVKEIETLKLGNHVKFYNKYVTLEEIIQYLRATDLYVLASPDLAQSVSGNLSYALGAGRPIVSTKTEYAKYIIDESNGILVDSRSRNQITKAIIEILSDSKMMKSMSEAAYEKSRHMIWPNVARRYFNIYKKFANVEPEEDKLPEVKFNHLMRLTDNFGVLHHAKYSKPLRRYGYSSDDNSRALIAATRYYKLKPIPHLLALVRTYLDFLKFVRQPSGYFSNIVSFKKQRDNTKDGDVLGRSVWALGYAASSDFLPRDTQKEADRMLNKSLKLALKLQSPRAIAFAMIGLYFYLKRFDKKSVKKIFAKLAVRQMKFYELSSSAEWDWFEDRLTYSNSKLPESLFYAYDLLGEKKYLRAAISTLDFLSKITFLKNYYAPIGQNGWYFRDQKRSYFDQQPEDAASMVETKVVAWKITKNQKYMDDAFRAFRWFLGKNNLNQMVYDEVTGGCHDGVGQYAMNLNQGAESTISYLMARLALEDI
ncbi:glycosyltransferase family 4 protein [Candidatus Wolfebacteria bacterium]|nr:glycosyltransferase family 4 protein [Candidatus Wolfebacteria bacterium]